MIRRFENKVGWVEYQEKADGTFLFRSTLITTWRSTRLGSWREITEHTQYRGYEDVTCKSCCGGSGHIRWSGTDKQWKCTDCGSVKSNDPNYYWTPKNSPDAVTYPSWGSVETKKCTCGSSAVGSDRHSDWCDRK